jgi:hypothetical protein
MWAPRLVVEPVVQPANLLQLDLKSKEAKMKKFSLISFVLVISFMVTVLASAAMASDHHGGGKDGKLLLFQKCDASLIGTTGFDSLGCPNSGIGPWPIFPDNQRGGKLEYSLWGKKFEFSFEGHNLLPRTNYTLIYYPDPWPGSGLICLGSGTTNKRGNIGIRGKMDIGTSLPASYDTNFNPVSPSGAVGAKIWLVLSDDVQCTNGTMMSNWNPTAYLFEYHLIIYTRTDKDFGDDEEN